MLLYIIIYEKLFTTGVLLIILPSPFWQVVRSRWQTPAGNRTSAEPGTDRRRRWRLPVAWLARPRPSGAPWRSRNPSVSTIPASRRKARPCLGTARRRKCVYRRTRRKFSLPPPCHVLLLTRERVGKCRVCLRTLWQEVSWRRRDV